MNRTVNFEDLDYLKCTDCTKVALLKKKVASAKKNIDLLKKKVGLLKKNDRLFKKKKDLLKYVSIIEFLLIVFLISSFFYYGYSIKKNKPIENPEKIDNITTHKNEFLIEFDLYYIKKLKKKKSNTS